VKRSQEALPRIRAGRFLVYGAHIRDQVRPNDIAIHIEAGLAFGTGHHATTRGCLLAIEATLKARRPRSALDVGTGSGVLAIALARHGIPVVATDIDPVAVRIADENARLNGVATGVSVGPMPAIPRQLPAYRPSGGYDLVVANILLGPLLTLAPAIARAVSAGGTVILSGLLPDQRQPIVATYRSVGLRLRRWFVHDGWLVVVMERPARLTPRREPSR
jgi:ribosomal protein L11 methyltransferase